MTLSARKSNIAFLIEGAPSQFYEKIDAKEIDQITYQEFPEVEWAVNIAHANDCKMFDPITQAQAIALNELYIEANEKDKTDSNKNYLAKTVYIIGFMFGPIMPLHELTLYLSPAESHKAKMPAWLNNLTLQNFKDLPKQHGFEMAVEDYVEISKIYFVKYNQAAQKMFIDYLTDNPEINIVYGLIGKAHLSMLSGYPQANEKSVADDHQLIKLTVKNREIEIHLFGGQHSNLSTCRHLAEWLNVKGMTVPDLSVDREREVFSQTWGRMARFYDEITTLEKHNFFQLVILEHADFFEMDANDLTAFILHNVLSPFLPILETDISVTLMEKLIPLIENKLKTIDDKSIAKTQKDLILRNLQELKNKFEELKNEFHYHHASYGSYVPIFNAILNIMIAIQLHATTEKSQTLKELLKQIDADLLKDATQEQEYINERIKARIKMKRKFFKIPEKNMTPLMLIQEYLGYVTDEQADYVVQSNHPGAKQSSSEANPSAAGIFGTATEKEQSNTKPNKDPSPATNADVKTPKKI